MFTARWIPALGNAQRLIDNGPSGRTKANNCEETTMWQRLIISLFAFVALAATTLAHAGFDEELAALQQRWATIRYESTGAAQQQQLEKLIPDVDEFAKKNSDRADGYIWAGVVRGSLAEAINGISALSIVKAAKVDLEKALAIDPKAEDGYAYGVLGLMYSKVPGWPIAFGDNKKAKELLQQGLAVSPNGMNINFFYAQYLFTQGDAKNALPYADKAAAATPPYPPETSLAVANRQREIRELQERIKAKIK
jgi:tetratricopeptide (TPR) repeat protein